MSICEYDETFAGVPIPHLWLTGPDLWTSATKPEVTATDTSDSRQNFFHTVWDQPTFAPDPLVGAAIPLALTPIVTAPVAASIGAAYILLQPSPPQPQQWYRDDWPSTPVYILQSRFDRWEVYNKNFRQWHWRIGMEMIGFKFDALAPNMNRPMQLMVGEKDDYNYVHFAQHVPQFATGSLHKPDRGLTVQDTGHSIHNERPFFLANQIVGFPAAH
jgi:hypothetical protein